MHVLTFDDPVIGQVVLVGDRFIIGRSPEADLQINHSGVSRKHCQLFHGENGWTIEDLRSANHTYVNNSLLITPLLLKEGDTLRLDGSITATYRFDPEITAPDIDRLEDDTAILEPALEKRLDQIDLSLEALERHLEKVEGHHADLFNALKAEVDQLREGQKNLTDAVEGNRCNIDANRRAIADNVREDLVTTEKLNELIVQGRKAIATLAGACAIAITISLSVNVLHESERRALGAAIVETLTSEPTGLLGVIILAGLGKYAAPGKEKSGDSDSDIRLGGSRPQGDSRNRSDPDN